MMDEGHTIDEIISLGFAKVLDSINHKLVLANVKSVVR